MSSFLLFLCTILAHLCTSDNIEDLYDFDIGAWVLCRKVINGVNGNFGVGYKFSVTYELTNVGTQNANQIKIEDSWDPQYFKPTDSKNLESIVFEHKELKPMETVSFSYKLIPTATATVTPSRANISYSVGESEEYVAMKKGESSNWINTQDDLLVLRDAANTVIPYNVQQNVNNNQLIIVSSSVYSRNIASTLIYWILFILLSVASIVYPLCEYEASKGDFGAIPFGLGEYVKMFAQFVNEVVLVKLKQQMNKMNDSKKEK